MAADPYKYFRIEARELVDDLGRGVLDLEKGAATPELVARLLRLAHTLKGAARVVKQPAIADLAHAIEDRLAPLRAPDAHGQRVEIEPLLVAIDGISELLRALQAAPIAAEPAEAQPPAAAVATSGDELRGRFDVEEVDTLLEGLAEASVAFASLRHGIGDAERADHLAELLLQQVGLRSAARDNQGARAAGLATELRAVVGALHRELRRETERLGRELAQVRESAERLRLIPTSAVFSGLERIARDAANATGRNLRLETSGGDVRIDAHVLAAVQPALVQLVRNAVAHGIEPSDARRAAGKPETGIVRIEVTRRQSRIRFACVDDGRGLDLAAIEQLARARGVVSDTATPAVLIDALLRGGLSTASAVTDLAGRGVGLDVVREAAQRLEGTVRATTVAGASTVFELEVPVSMSSIEALVVEVAGIAAAIPLDAVRSTLRCATRDVLRSATGDSILHDGAVVPFARLRRPLVAGPERAAASIWPAVVVAHGDVLAAIRVDRVRGTQNIVLRPVPELAPADATIAGLSLDERGDPQLVLDPEGIVASAAHDAPTPRADERTVPLPILVIDDSLTTRMLEQSILESAGYAVEIAESAEDALVLARDRDYALFLVDVEMPGMDGFTFVETTRTDPRLREVPCILVTSRDAPEDRERGRAAGASAYMVKSEFDQNTLLGKIARIARRR
jgi:two-component system chemotaxis sensor kinase CheA